MLPDVRLELEWKGQRYESVTKGLAAVGAFTDEHMAKFIPIARKTLRDYMTGVVLSVKQRTETPWPQGTSPAGAFPGTLSKRSGTLTRELNPRRIGVTRAGSVKAVDEISVSFTLTGIAAVHERGAVITPKRARYLTVPLPAALDKRGVALFPRARDWQNTFVKRSKAGNLLIFQKRGKDQIVPLYVLKKRVVIPKRLAFEPAFEAGRSFLADALADEFLKEFNRG